VTARVRTLTTKGLAQMNPIRFRAACVVCSLGLSALLRSPDRAVAQGSSSAEFGKRHIELSTGIRMAYAEAGDPAGPTVILLHGYTDTGRSWHSTMRRLLVLRPELHLVALDQRGHGASSMPAPERCRRAPESCFRPADFAADLLAFMDQRGIARADLVGHSMGGLVAQEVALTHPERVERLVLVASWASMLGHPVVGEFIIRDLLAGPWKDALVQQGYTFPDDVYELTPLDADPQVEVWMAANWVTEPVADPAFLAEVLPETVRTRLGTWLGVARALLEIDNRERLKQLRVPTFVISATQDGMATASDEATLLASLHAAARSCKARFVLKRYGRKPVPASGIPEDDIAHNVQWAAGEAVAMDLASYLRKDGQPTRDLYYADPENIHRVISAPGRATLIEGRMQNCGARGPLR